MSRRFVSTPTFGFSFAIPIAIGCWVTIGFADGATTSSKLGQIGVNTGGATTGPSEKSSSPTTKVNPTGTPNPNAGSDLANAAARKGSISLGDDMGTDRKGHTTLVPPSHTVRKGDTLWDLCDLYYANPWQWPRVWSYNPEIVNPHWIYPGEIVRLKKEGGLTLSADQGTGAPKSGNLGVVLKPRTVQPGTVFLRNQGFIYDDKVEDTGELVGSPEENMLLSTYNQIYVRVTPEQAKKLYPGDSLTIFQNERPVKRGNDEIGKVVQILGTMKVDTVDRKTNLVQGTITEALDVIERGARVGPVERKMDVVPPSTNQVDLRGTILSSVHPNQLYGQNQIVFVDKGEKDGLAIGNRMFIVRKGDPWRKGLASAGALTASKITVSADGTAATAKSANSPEDAPDYPEEVVAEVRVLRVRKDTATCIVTTSSQELEPGDVWIAKKGY